MLDGIQRQINMQNDTLRQIGMALNIAQQPHPSDEPGDETSVEPLDHHLESSPAPRLVDRSVRTDSFDVFRSYLRPATQWDPPGPQAQERRPFTGVPDGLSERNSTDMESPDGHTGNIDSQKNEHPSQV